MAWLTLSFELAASQTEPVADALLEAGALSVEITDAQAGTPQESPLFDEPGAQLEAAWRCNRLSALFAARTDVARIAQAALTAAGVDPTPELSVASVPEQDWVRASRAQFGPIRVSERLWVVPSWCESPAPEALNLRLDPGLAFGTGGHPTTVQCLRWLDTALHPGSSVLDYGCGSGVLAIAAKRLGAGLVVAADIDPAALQASRDNTRTNGVDIQVATPEAVPPGPYDVVLANILSNPLRLLAPLLAGFSRPGGQVVLAGILGQQAEAVAAAYAPWYELQTFSEQEGWTCLTGKRRL